MSFLITGIAIGVMTALMFIILVEKLPPTLKELVLGHHLFSDVLFTAFTLGLLPVTGALTLLSAATVAVLFSLYLAVKRRTHPWRRIVIRRGWVRIDRHSAEGRSAW
jgi:hypothetical protein